MVAAICGGEWWGADASSSSASFLLAGRFFADEVDEGVCVVRRRGEKFQLPTAGVRWCQQENVASATVSPRPAARVQKFARKFSLSFLQNLDFISVMLFTASASSIAWQATSIFVFGEAQTMELLYVLFLLLLLGSLLCIFGSKQWRETYKSKSVDMNETISYEKFQLLLTNIFA